MSDFYHMSYSSHLREAIHAAKSAGKVVRQHFGKNLRKSIKSNSRDIVTEVDIHSQSVIVNSLKKKFPDIPIISEEQESKDLDQAVQMSWIIDPLSGTTNYTRSIEFFSIAICLASKSVPIVAVVYDPVRDHLYTAELGMGAFFNGKRIFVSKTQELSEFLVSCNVSYDNSDRIVTLNKLRRYLCEVAGVRIFSSINLELCMLARGSLDAVLIYHAEPWDLAAGCLLVRESGGVVSNWSGDEWTTKEVHCLGSNGLQHSRLGLMLSEEKVHERVDLAVESRRLM